MSALTGVLSGAIALATLELVISSQSATKAYSGAVGLTTGALARFMDPNVPMFADHSKSGAAPTAVQASTAMPPPSTLPPIVSV